MVIWRPEHPRSRRQACRRCVVAHAQPLSRRAAPFVAPRLRDCYPLHPRLNQGCRTHFWYLLSPQKISSLTFRVSPRPVVVVTGQVTRAFRMMKNSGQDDLWWPNGCQKWILHLKPRLVWTLWGSLWSGCLIVRVMSTLKRIGEGIYIYYNIIIYIYYIIIY